MLLVLGRLLGRLRAGLWGCSVMGAVGGGPGRFLGRDWECSIILHLGGSLGLWLAKDTLTKVSQI